MKKIAVLLVFTLLLSAVFAIGASAHYNGVRDQQNYDVPKVNPANPKVNFDGKVDLSGEWAGALKVTFDMSKENDELTVWDASVWDSSILPLAGEWSDIPESSRLTWDYYYLWDVLGLYIGVVCENDPTNPGPLDVAAYRGEGYDGNKMTDRHSFEIVPSDDFEGLNNSPGNMYWWYFWSETNFDNFWLEGQTTGFNSFDNDPDSWGVKVNGSRETQPNDKGCYPYNMEIFIPWNCLKYDTDGTPTRYEFTAAEGFTFMMGMIAEDRTGDTETQLRVTNGSGWWNYDFFKLTAPVAAVVAEVTEPETTEAVEQSVQINTPVVVPTPTPTPTPTVPPTGDGTLILVVLLAISGAAIIALRAKKSKN